MMDAQEKFNQALQYHQQGILPQAKKLYSELLKENAQHFDALHLLGVIAYQEQDDKRSHELIAQALVLNANSAIAHSNLGLVLQRMGNLAEAIAHLNRAIALKPDFADAHYNLGTALQADYQLEQAISSFQRAIALNPQHVSAYTNCGFAFQGLGQITSALNCYDQAISINPQHALAYWNKSLTYLLAEDFSRGFQLYEWRWRWDSFASPKRTFSQPLWLGKDNIRDKTILLYHEQGLGDTIQFCRYVQQVVALGARVILEVQAPLKSLLQNLYGINQVLATGEVLPAFDYQCPLLSLPLALGGTIENIPDAMAYLHASPEKLHAWQIKLGSKTKPRIGLVWSGHHKHLNDMSRSISLEKLLLQLPVTWDCISLQKEIRPHDLDVLKRHAHIREFSAEINDFSDTAALCSLMDVVISVDTSVAHLSGALGVPTAILLHYVNSWRWFLGRDDSPWYSSVRLFRQKKPNEWSHVIKAVIDFLPHWIASK